MLSNAYFLAKFRFDTAENEPAKKFAKICKFEYWLLSFFEELGVSRRTCASAPGACASPPGPGRPPAWRPTGPGFLGRHLLPSLAEKETQLKIVLLPQRNEIIVCIMNL